MIRLFGLIAGLLLLAACAAPQAPITVDCRGATAWCGALVDQRDAKAMSSQTLPVSAFP